MPPGKPFDVQDLRFGVECEFTAPDTAKVRWGLPARYRAAAHRRSGGSRWIGLAWGSLTVRHAQSGLRTRLFPHRDQRVLEIATEPLSLDQFRRGEALFQDVVWDACRDVGLTPGTDEINRWSMHVNVSWPALCAGGDGDLLLRYVADFNDHPELAMGGCGGDIRNAPPLAILGPRPREALQQVVASIAARPEHLDAFAVARLLRQRVFRERFVYGSSLHNDFYHAVNVCHVRPRPVRKRRFRTASLVRIEIRASYMAPSAAHLVSMLEIIAGRLAYLAGRSSPIHYLGPLLADPPGGRLFRTRGVQDGVTAEGVAACWIRYLEESGVDAARHAPYLVNPDVRATAQRLLQATIAS
jgi:hypothetical protein